MILKDKQKFSDIQNIHYFFGLLRLFESFATCSKEGIKVQYLISIMKNCIKIRAYLSTDANVTILFSLCFC